MPDDEKSLGPLEEQLAAEAERMLADSPERLPISGLRAELVRRRRQRTLAQVACAAAAIVVVGFLVTNWKDRPGSEIERGPTVAGHAHTATSGASSKLATHDVDSDAPKATGENERTPFMAIAILIPRTGNDGEPELVPGWYVPGQIEEIDANDLSPAERSAMSQLLGPDYDFSEDDTI